MVWKSALVVQRSPVAYGTVVVYGLVPWISMTGPVVVTTLWIYHQMLEWRYLLLLFSSTLWPLIPCIVELFSIIYIIKVNIYKIRL